MAQFGECQLYHLAAYVKLVIFNVKCQYNGQVSKKFV